MRLGVHRNRAGLILGVRETVAETVVPGGTLAMSVAEIGGVGPSEGGVAIEMVAAKAVADGPNVTAVVRVVGQPPGNV